MLTPTRISELAKKPRVKSLAVSNFLSTLSGMTLQEALGNLELDARSYKWSHETRNAIHTGIMEFFGR